MSAHRGQAGHPAMVWCRNTMPTPRSSNCSMPSVNDQLTVMQLIDLVTFLQPHYRKLEPLYEPYYTMTGM
jgi:hypothetical protein